MTTRPTGLPLTTRAKVFVVSGLVLIVVGTWTFLSVRGHGDFLKFLVSVAAIECGLLMLSVPLLVKRRDIPIEYQVIAWSALCLSAAVIIAFLWL